jgi:serine/threonine-protein kinase
VKAVSRSALSFGPYAILEELGSGALSTVYKAVQEPLGRVVAIKALKETIAPSSPFATQLEREARVLGQLAHPNIVLLFDFVKTDSQMYLVLEHIDGWSLAHILARRTRFSPELVAAIGVEVARALAYAHEHGVVHRDVKPANILVSKRGEVKLVDFGIAQRDRLPSADEPLTPVHLRKSDASAAFGTPAYMSPEQILGETVDSRSDVFSLGVVLYQLLAGVRPFDREGDHDKRAAAQRIRRDPPKPLRERAPDVPRALERIVMRCVEKLPADRFASAEEAATLLEEFYRERSDDKPSSVLQRTLVSAGLLEGEGGATEVRAAEVPRAGLGPVLIGFGALALVFVLGGAAIQWSASGERNTLQAGARALELMPARQGFLRVLATPWAEVFVDGQRIDVTPFARPIPLGSGTHYVTLKHPNAPAEKRVVSISAGETTLVDVSMNVQGAPSGEGDARASKDGGT